VLYAHLDMLRGQTPLQYPIEDGYLYCGTCGGRRRMRTRVLYSHGRDAKGGDIDPSSSGDGDFNKGLLLDVGPALLIAECLQCQAEFTVVIFHRQGGEPGIAVLPGSHGGLGTPHTPPQVTYYLDQAQLAQSVGAYVISERQSTRFGHSSIRVRDGPTTSFSGRRAGERRRYAD
jgi:hypothetical protein